MAGRREEAKLQYHVFRKGLRLLEVTYATARSLKLAYNEKTCTAIATTKNEKGVDRGGQAQRILTIHADS